MEVRVDSCVFPSCANSEDQLGRFRFCCAVGFSFFLQLRRDWEISFSLVEAVVGEEVECRADRRGELYENIL